MSQAPIAISTTPPLPGTQLVDEANAALEAIATDFAGPTDPAGDAVAYSTWADTGTGYMNRRNSANSAWENIGRIVPTIQENASGELVFPDATIQSTAATNHIEWQTVKTSGFTAVSKLGYPVNTTSGAITAILPATPTAGDYVELLDYAHTFKTNALTINPNGSKIAGSASSVVVSTNGASVSLVYIDSTMGWIVFSGFANSPINQPQNFGFKNRVINGGFTINQRVYVSGAALGAGVYGHDRWKAGASGCTYTFSAGSAGVPVPITITAGSLQQVIEGGNLPEGGTYTLSWTGTAQGKIAGGSYAASPITITGATAGANVTIEFGTGTLTSVVQVEVGGIQTSSEYRDFERELAMCQRYFEKSYQLSSAPGSLVGWAGMLWASNGGATDIYCLVTATFKVQKRTTPTITYWDSAGNSSRSSIVSGGGLAQTNNASLVYSFNATDSQVTMVILTNAQYNAGSAWAASAEL